MSLLTPPPVNPFTRRDTHSGQTILIYKITTTLSYLLLLITAIYFTFNAPPETHRHHRDGYHSDYKHTIWGQNAATPFAQDSILTSIYWIVVFLLQLYYLFSFYKPASEVHLAAAGNIAPHFIAHNLLLFGFINLWVRSHFWLSLLLIIINFFNLSIGYFRYVDTPQEPKSTNLSLTYSSHPRTPLFIHASTLSLPLAWSFVALYWVGARAFLPNHHSGSLAARIVGNIFIWGILAYGTFYLVAFKDASIGLGLSVLAFSTAVGQFLTKIPILQVQWIEAFVIGGLLFLLSAAVASGKDLVGRGAVVSEDRERAPLLAEDRV